MYESPIIQNIFDISSQIRREQDGRLIYEVQQAIGYDIDRVELIKALNYDRDQYQKGYEDGRKHNEWIPVSERLPELHQKVLATYVTEDGANIAITYYDKHGFLIAEVTAWQPLPEPYNSESESEE